MRLAAVMALGVSALAWGCGTDQPTSSAGAPQRVSAVKACLQAGGLKVTGGAGAPVSGDANAPDRGEIATHGTLIGFYSSTKRATQLRPQVERRARRLHGAVAQHGPVVVLYLNTSARRIVERCLAGA